MPNAPAPGPAQRPWLSLALAGVVLFVIPAWALIASGYVRDRGAFDQLNYHEQVVRTFAEQFPALDYSNYLSATTPGYHTLLAAAAHLGADSRWILQGLGSLFTVGLLALLAWGVAAPGSGARDPSRTRLALLLPLIASMPVFYAGVWMLPDNAGWLGVLAVWLLALRPRFTPGTIVAGGLLLAALVFVRQIHLWPLAMLLAAAWLGSRSRPGEPFDFAADLRDLTADLPARLARVGVVLLAALPAVAVLVWFWRLWGGLTPPVFVERHVGGNPSAPAFVLALFGGLGLFFVPFVWGGLRLLWVRHWWLLLLALGLGLLLALAPETSRSYGEGRYSGLWEVARQVPAPADRSLLVAPLAVVGAVLVAAWFVALEQRDRWIMLAALVAFTAAQCASFKLWQRYSEPFVLLWLALAAARTAAPLTGAGQSWRVIGPSLLALCLAAVTAASLATANPVRQRELVAPWEDEPPLLPGMVPRRLDRAIDDTPEPTR